MASNKVIGYQQSGVNIDEADRAVAYIKGHAKTTLTGGVITDIGSFGAGYLLSGWKRPVLISSADGVGTKLKIALMANRHDTVGEDLVNHCVNDIAVQGAVPLFFLDYFAAGALKASIVDQVVAGIARGCRENKCALIGGETAEMPGMYQGGEYDLAGFIVGAVEKREMLTGKRIKEGDVLLGLPSSGLHTNGYSLVRRLLFEEAKTDLTPELADELLKVHRSYLKPIRKLVKAGLLKGAAHITGGGITDNLPRILPEGCGARVEWGTWPVPEIFERLRAIGNIPKEDYRRTFNLGIGMICVVGRHRVGAAKRVLDKMREPWFEVGEVVAGEERRVVYERD